MQNSQLGHAVASVLVVLLLIISSSESFSLESRHSFKHVARCKQLKRLSMSALSVIESSASIAAVVAIHEAGMKAEYRTADAHHTVLLTMRSSLSLS